VVELAGIAELEVLWRQEFSRNGCCPSASLFTTTMVLASLRRVLTSLMFCERLVWWMTVVATTLMMALHVFTIRFWMCAIYSIPYWSLQWSFLDLTHVW
jgi:hypothetical protein